MINLGIQDYLQGGQNIDQYNNDLNQSMAVYGQQYGDFTGQQGDVTPQLESAADSQDQTIADANAAYDPYYTAAGQTGQNALETENQDLALENQTAGVKTQATNDVGTALSEDQNVYQPGQVATIGSMVDTLDPASQAAMGADTQAADYAMSAFNNPEQWASQAGTDVNNSFAQQLQATQMTQAGQGIDPSSGAAQNADIDLATNAALAKSGAETKAREGAMTQNITDQQIGTGELNAGVAQYGSNLDNTNTQLSKGPEAAGTNIFNNTSTFSPTTASSMMSVAAPSSTSAATTDLGWNSNPVAPNYANLASLGLSQQSLLPQAWSGFNGSYNTTNSLDTSEANANAQGLGQATGLGLSTALGGKNGTLSGLLGSSDPNANLPVTQVIQGSGPVADTEG
jgi:hypothetical protein